MSASLISLSARYVRISDLVFLSVRLNPILIASAPYLYIGGFNHSRGFGGRDRSNIDLVLLGGSGGFVTMVVGWISGCLGWSAPLVK